MSDQEHEVVDSADAAEEEDGSEDFLIDILTGNKEGSTPRKLLIQKVLRQLIESYGFDRSDIQVGYNPKIPGHGRKKVDVAIFRGGTMHTNEYLQRVILCKTQKKRDKLRSLTEAEGDVRELKELMELLPDASLGQEEFLFQVERARFEVRAKPLGVWPVPGEHTSDLERTGGVIQISAEAEDLEDALLRARQYLNRNLGLDHKDSFKQLAVLLLAKMHDEIRAPADRQFWIKGDEPFQEAGQREIHRRICECIEGAKVWQPNLLARGWDLTLEPHQTAKS